MSPRARAVIAALSWSVLILAASAFALSAERSPDRQVGAYLGAVSRGDESGALRVWRLFECCVPRPDLEAHRAELTRELTSLRAGATYSIEWIEWWSSCCMPEAPLDDPTHAGRARVLAHAVDPSGRMHSLIFDVQTEQGCCLGTSLGKTWIVRDVHRAGERSLLGGPAQRLSGRSD